MPRNVFIVLFTYIIVSNNAIQLQTSSTKHYGTDVFILFSTSLWEDSHQEKARAKCCSYGNNNNNKYHSNPQLSASLKKKTIRKTGFEPAFSRLLVKNYTSATTMCKNRCANMLLIKITSHSPRKLFIILFASLTVSSIIQYFYIQTDNGTNGFSLF
jgi:hypothetical protein